MGKRIYIGITGTMQSGKDTLANAIADAAPVEWREPFYHFADPLKEAAQAMLGGTVSNYWGKDADKNAETGFADDLGAEFATFRSSMQTFGSIMRKHNPHFWVVLAKHRIDAHLAANPNRDMILLFPDVRHDNEAQFIRSRGGLIVRIWRADGKVITSGIAGHESEAGISEDLVTHRFAIGPNGHAHVARIVLDQAGVKP